MSPMLLHVAAHQVLQRRGGEEIFLPQPQFLAGRRRIAGIEHPGDRLGLDALGQRAGMVAAVEGIEAQRVARARRPQAQRVDVPAAPADDRRVVGDGLHGLGRTPMMALRAVLAASRHRLCRRSRPRRRPRGRSNSQGLPKVSQSLGILVLPAVLDAPGGNRP